MKTYSSKYCVSLNVKIAGGGYMHVSFSPMTGGGSRYCTVDLAVQEALERHPKFGRLFSLDGAEKTHGPAAEPQGTVVKGRGADQTRAGSTTLPVGGGNGGPLGPAAVDGPAAEPQGTVVEGGNGGPLGEEDGASELDGVLEAVPVDGDGRTVRVDSLSEAREYLSEHFGISRTKMRNKAAILEAAEGVGISFEGV